MSAYNEEAVIVAKIDSLLQMAAHYGNATIHVYADAPTDRTVELLQPFADRIDLVVSEVRTGKTYGMNTLVARSTSELLLFTDANVVHDSDIVDRLIAPLADPEVGCTCPQLIYSNFDESATAAAGAAYWMIEERIKQLESRSLGMVGVDGAMFVMRRSLHRPPPPHLIDDLYLSLIVLISGSRLVSVDDIRVYERSAVSAGEEFTRKLRIACQAMNVHRALWPQLRRTRPIALYGYLSHRLIKWLTPFLLAAAAACFVAAAMLRFGVIDVSLALIVVLLLALLAYRLRFRPALILWPALVNLGGVALGVMQSLFTERTYTVWNPAMSVRDEGTPSAAS